MHIQRIAVALLFSATTPVLTNADWFHTIQLNDQANRGVIEDNGDPDDNILQIRSTNGTFETIEFEEPDGELVLDMGAGDDNISVMVSLNCNVVLRGGAGNDQTTFRTVTGLGLIDGNVTSHDLEGDNSMHFTSITVAGDVVAIDGDGRQGVSGFAARIEGNVIVTSPDGGSGIGFSQCLIGTSERINGNLVYRNGHILVDNRGYGNDRFSMNRASARGDVYLEFGNGDLSMSVIQAGVNSFSSTVDSGTTDIFLGELGSRSDIHLDCREGSTNLRAWSPFVRNRFSIKSGLGYDTILVAGMGRSGLNPSATTLDIDAGDGGSDITIRSQGALGARTTIDHVNILTGDETDQLTVSFVGTQSLIGSLIYEGGSGNSSIRIEDRTENSGSAIGEVAILQGARNRTVGRDVLAVDSATITGNLNLFSDSGGVDVQLDGATILGDVNLHSQQSSGPEPDYVAVAETSVTGNFNWSTFGFESYVSVTDSVFGGNFIADASPQLFHNLIFAGNLVGGFFFADGYEYPSGI